MTKWVKRGQKQCNVFHTNKDCRQLKREPIKATQRDIDILELSECKVCAGEADYSPCDRGYYEALKEAADD